MSNQYENPLGKRYAGKEMQFIFSDDNKFSTWRRLWLALAEAERELGLGISEVQIEEMKAHLSDVDYEMAARREKEVRHDVMAHIYAFGKQCPASAPIIHLGATSSFVGDNTDLILIRSGLFRVKKLLVNLIAALAEFAKRYKELPTLAYTHFQPAQPTTLGKRAALWISDLIMDLAQLDFVLENIKLLGCKGTTGTAASFLALFDGDHEKVKRLEKIIAGKMGFEAVYPVSGQTYSRKVDFTVLSALSGIAQSASKFAGDFRLLSHLREVEEPFEEGQVGSSAMAYKRNPMRSERIASLSRYVMTSAMNPAVTAASQWLERTLDDSANRRICVPEAFLATDAILSLYINIISGVRVYPKIMEKHLAEELPFIATENILMYCVKKGGNRQELHESIREHAAEAAGRMKEEGAENDLLRRIKEDPTFGLSETELMEILSAGRFTGCAEEQTEEFLEEVRRILRENEELLGMEIEIRV